MDDELYGQMLYGTLPPDTQDFQSVLRGIGRTLANQGRAAGQSVIDSGQRAEALQSQAFPDPNRPLQLQNPQALAQLTEMIMNGPMSMAQMGITAYHGSPYLFRQLDPMKIGTGEGAQAYGAGAGYTAEARPVAEEYAQNISRNKFIEESKKQGQSAAYATEVSQLQQMVGDIPIQDYYTKLQLQANKLPIKQAEDAYAKLDIVERLGLGSNIPEIRQYAKEAQYSKSIQNWIEKELVPKYKPAGYLYKGDIPDEILPKFLDWNKPLSQQSEDVRNVLKRRIVGVEPQDKFDMGGNARLRDNRNGKVDPTSTRPWLMEATDESGTKFFGLTQKDVDRMFGSKDAKDLTGEQIYARLTQDKGSQQEASAYLDSIGVRGIRYLDQVSRGEGKGTSNFVPFRSEDFKVQEINDIPIEQYYQKGLLSKPMSPKEQAKAAWEANPDNKELFEAYRKLRLEE